jgi:hypothetical protein
VDIKFKLYRLSDFKGKEGTFYVDCILMLDWEDPSLALAATNDENGLIEPDFHEHFWPKPELLNKAPDSPEFDEWETTLPKYKRDKKNKNGWGEHRCALTYKFRAILFARLDFRKFPFDSQALEISVKLLSVSTSVVPLFFSLHTQ